MDTTDQGTTTPTDPTGPPAVADPATPTDPAQLADATVACCEDVQDPEAVAIAAAAPAEVAADDLSLHHLAAAAGRLTVVDRYDQWRNSGGHFQVVQPIADLAALLRRYGYTVGTIGNRSHFNASVPEDHTTCSATGWPGRSPSGWVSAADIMPPAPGSGLPSLERLGAQLVADRAAGVPGAAWVKYVNWTDTHGACWHDSWQPGYSRRRSNDRGHIHASCRTDYQHSTCAAGYDLVARARAAGGPIPTPVPAPPVAGAPAFPGRVLHLVRGAGMIHGGDVKTWQAKMAGRGWRITVDGWYGPQSADVCTRFQRDSTAHGWPLAADGQVGPATWRATWARPVS